MGPTPQGAIRRIAAAFLFVATALTAAASERPFVGSMAGSEGALFPGSRSGSYGFVRDEKGAVTYFRVNGRETRARALDAQGRVVGTFSDRQGQERPFVIRVPRGGSYVEVTIESADDDEDLVG